MRRREKFTTHSIHHIYNRSIAKFRVFNSPPECARMYQLVQYYQFTGQRDPFSDFIRMGHGRPRDFETRLHIASGQQRWAKVAEIVAWCLIPNHYHFIVRQLKEGGIEGCLRRSLDAYTRYLNLRRNRRGPLWETRMHNKRIIDSAHLATVVAYVHGNPVKHRLVKEAKEWPYSSIHGFDEIGLQTLEIK